MQALLVNNPANAKHIAINNITSCVYIGLIVLWLHFTDSLFDIGHFKNTYLQWILAIAELAKYLAFSHYAVKDPKQRESKKFRAQNLFKTAFTILAMIAVFQAVAILFGAPFFSRQEETFTFALTMTILTVLPCCLYLGSDKSASIMLLLTSGTNNETYKKFLIIVQLTCLAAWLGATVIPLDWNRPFQVWPVPCILGALSGYFLGNLVLAGSYFLQKKTKKSLKVEC